jgi:peptidoglycan/LPS O-acetylase OafA/YrhL
VIAPTPTRLPALDGLRGIAIALVLFSHFGGGIGGQAGVTLFFVLSGFLITSLLLSEHARVGRVSLPAFYMRRARRLLPAIVAMVAIVCALGVSILVGLAALSYVANWIIIGVGRIDPLSHTWSLAIEEQFYLVWPLALIALMRWGSSRMLAVLIVAASASFVWRTVLVVQGATIERIAFGSDVRADSLLIGCALAVAIMAGVRARFSPLVPVAVLIALVPLSGYHWFGMTVGWLAISVVSAVAIAAVLNGWRPLEWGPLVGLGRISYGVYLWHFPLVYAISETVSPWVRVPLLVILTLAISLASYYLVELPFLRGRRATESRPLWIPTDSQAA